MVLDCLLSVVQSMCQTSFERMGWSLPRYLSSSLRLRLRTECPFEYNCSRYDTLSGSAGHQDQVCFPGLYSVIEKLVLLQVLQTHVLRCRSQIGSVTLEKLYVFIVTLYFMYVFIRIYIFELHMFRIYF